MFCTGSDVTSDIVNSARLVSVFGKSHGAVAVSICIEIRPDANIRFHDASQLCDTCMAKLLVPCLRNLMNFEVRID